MLYLILLYTKIVYKKIYILLYKKIVISKDLIVVFSMKI